ncbi:MAG: hypothetical protein Kow0092_24230 [Deferrisomatales bacterium]
MAVKVITTKRIKEGKTHDALALLKQFRFQAYEQPGYITGEELIGYTDPQKIVVINMWHDIENWNRWKACEGRKEIEINMEPLLSSPTVHEVFLLGTNIIHE